MVEFCWSWIRRHAPGVAVGWKPGRDGQRSTRPGFPATSLRGQRQEVVMNHSKSRTSYGVYSPLGCVLASFPTEGDARAAIAELEAAGFAAEDVEFQSAEEVRLRATHDIHNSGLLARIGQEVNLAKSRRALAEQGHPFVAVYAPGAVATRSVAEIARHCHADFAQKFGRLIVEELIESETGGRQVPESPDTGLDFHWR
ncbi:MAG TPA: hypothetical protein VIN75_19920 [Burkholderiaceae bacterium]